MQLWPANEKAFAASFAAARSRSASAATTTGVELPSSSRTRLRAARSARLQPTPLEPVNVISRTRSSSTSTSPISADGPPRTISLPSGRSATCSRSARQAGLQLQLGEEQGRERGLACRLEHDRAAGGERRRELEGHEVAREVEGGDRADDADRPAEGEGHLAGSGFGGLHRHHVSRQLPGFDGGERVGRDGAGGLHPGGPDRLARLRADRLRHLLVALAQELRHPVEDRRPLVRRQRRGERPCGGLDRLPRLRGARLRGAAHHLAGVGRALLDPLAGLDPLPVEEELAYVARDRQILASLVSSRCSTLTISRSTSAATSSSRGSAGPASSTASTTRTGSSSSTAG